ncbi:deoxynucleoside kinase [Paenibacillus sp. MBLB2552]|uniref:Deoxynucleoside kinase n=1 Tax=Paenibacillus mellifer TaxID=2937794 RepID=A0A9X1Y8H0_9BACL|nr:deoxynucleoside kinase [Paenibacillus mellifer]MCK8489202.1 deoxynucleoside kinase [Paenibacillus mellifer]
MKKPCPFIAVEGAIGAGKTTLATMLAERFDYPLLKEIVDENPFLDKFYQNIEEWAFQLEMFFLCNRYKQLEDTVQNYVSQGLPVVSDYHIYKNWIFAQRTLHGDKREKYRQIYHLLTDDLPKPNVIVYIHTELATLLKRIEKRGRSFEQDIDPGYLERLIEDYEMAITQLRTQEPDTVIITIDGNELDFVEHPEHFEQIVAKIKEHL